jgi:oxalate---CoA ligase
MINAIDNLWQAELVWRLRSIYDRQEVRDVLRYLHQGLFVETRSCPVVPETPLREDRDEKTTFWFISDRRHWYEV